MKQNDIQPEITGINIEELKNECHKKLVELFFQYGFCNKDNVTGVVAQSYLEMSEDMVYKIHSIYTPYLSSKSELKKEAVYDPVRLGTFVSDLERFNKEIDAKIRTAREDVYWAIIKREMAESGNEPKSLIKEKGQEGYTEWLKGLMKFASFSEVGLYRTLARADVKAKEEIYKLEYLSSNENNSKGKIK